MKYLEIFRYLRNIAIFLQVQNNVESSLWRLVLQPVLAGLAALFIYLGLVFMSPILALLAGALEEVLTHLLG